MPHLTLLYSHNLESEIPFDTLCDELADTLCGMRDAAGKAVFPIGGVRVLAYPSRHYAIGDRGAAGRKAGGSGDYGFLYLNLRVANGRAPEVLTATGDALLAVARRHVEPLLATRHLGLTVNIDESGSQVYDGKHSNLHPLFR